MLILKSPITCLFLCFLILLTTACQSSLGEKGAWTKEYETFFLTECINKTKVEVIDLNIDSLTINELCTCVTERTQKQLAPLDLEEEKNETLVESISTACAKEILSPKE